MARHPEPRPDHSKPLPEGLSGLQTSVERLLHSLDDEAMASEIADILHDIAALRLYVDLPQEGDRRQNLREPRRDISIFSIDGQDVDCAIQDLSIGGAYIVADLPVEPDTEIELSIPEAGIVSARVVRATENGVHVQFEELSDEQMIAIADSLKAHYLA